MSFRILTILLAFIFIISCKQQETEVSEIEIVSTAFSGKITNPTSDTTYVRRGDFKQMFALAEDGSFEGQLKIEHKGFYTFSDGGENTSIYLTPGKDLKITLDTEEFDESIKYSGSAAGDNNYLAAKYMREETNFDTKEIYSLSEGDFIKKINEVSQDNMSFLNSQHGLSEGFRAQAVKEITFEKISHMNNFEEYHAYFSEDEDFKVSDSFPNLIKSLDMDNEKEYTNSAAYASLVSGYYLSGETSEILARVKEVKSKSIKKGLVKNLGYMMAPNEENNEAIYETLITMTEDQEKIDAISEKYKILSRLKKGEKSPLFKYKDINGYDVALKDLKGKNVYIDIWATWCGPCKKEIPHLKEMEAKMHDQNIEFVSISIDKKEDYDKWVAMVKEEDLKGVQLISDKDWESRFVTSLDLSW